MWRSTRADAEELARVIRPADAAECEASGRSALEDILLSLELSDVAFTVRFDGEVAAIYGVGVHGDTMLGTTSVAWLLTGRGVSRHPKVFLRLCKSLLRELRKLYPLLENAVDMRYTAALRWTKWLGFRFGEIIPVGPQRMPFRHVLIGG